MNKRQKKKLAKDILGELVYEVSTDVVWRKKLFEAKYRTLFELNYEGFSSMYNWQLVPRLSFTVEKQKNDGKATFYSGDIFCFKSNNFPRLVGTSGNPNYFL